MVQQFIVAPGLSEDNLVGTDGMTLGDLKNRVGQPWSTKWERAAVNPGATLTLANITGSGYAHTLNIAIAGSGIDVDKSTVSFYVDGETSPSVVLTLGELGTYGANQFHTRYMSSQSAPGLSGVTFRVPALPFSKNLQVVLTNNGAAQFTAWGWLAGNQGGQIFWGRRYRLRTAHTGGQYSNAVQVAPFAEQTLLDVTGRGEFWGMNFFIDFQNNVPGGNNNAIEGNFRYYINGSIVYESSGLEDYFLSAFGFQGPKGEFPGPLWAMDSVGLYVNSFHGESDSTTKAQLGLWRWHDLDPVQFDGNFRVTWTAGDAGIGLDPTTKSRLAVTAFYYTDR